MMLQIKTLNFFFLFSLFSVLYHENDAPKASTSSSAYTRRQINREKMKSFMLWEGRRKKHKARAWVGNDFSFKKKEHLASRLLAHFLVFEFAFGSSGCSFLLFYGCRVGKISSIAMRRKNNWKRHMLMILYCRHRMRQSRLKRKDANGQDNHANFVAFATTWTC